MNVGDRVAWTTSKGVKGSGFILSTVSDGRIENFKHHYLVVVDAEPGEEHRVIFCAETWLTLIQAG